MKKIIVFIFMILLMSGCESSLYENATNLEENKLYYVFISDKDVNNRFISGKTGKEVDIDALDEIAKKEHLESKKEMDKFRDKYLMLRFFKNDSNVIRIVEYALTSNKNEKNLNFTRLDLTYNVDSFSLSFDIGEELFSITQSVEDHQLYIYGMSEQGYRPLNVLEANIK